MVHVTKVSWKELMARFTQNWYVSIVQGKNNANSTGAIFSNVPVMPWIHHRLHPVLVRIFLRLGLSKTLKEERVFSPGERVDHVVLATRGVTARAIGSTKLSDHKCRSRLCSAEYFGGTRQARQSNQRTAASSV